MRHPGCERRDSPVDSAQGRLGELSLHLHLHQLHLHPHLPVLGLRRLIR
jgi:hypothetical protein